MANGHQPEAKSRTLSAISKAMHTMNNRNGFTLVEVIVILAVLAILAAVAIPMALRIFETAAEDATREEMANLKEAMVGDPNKLQSSFRSDFGFLGDIGCVPTTLDRLLTNGTLPTPFSFDSTKQTGAGWNGPYIIGAATGEETGEFTKDQLGNDYTYTASGACPLSATLTSDGPDGQPSSGDEITLSITANETTATIRGKVKDTTGAGLEAVPVEFYSAVNGVLTTTPANTDANGEYVFTSAPFGPRAVSAKPRLVLSPGTVAQAQGGKDISFRVLNYSESAYTITAIRANFDPVADDYDQITIIGSIVDSGNNFISGQDVIVTATTIAASPATRPSVRVFIDSPNTQLADITISGQGTAADIEINNFNKSVRGTTMKVTFNPNGASSVVTFLVP